MIINEQTNSCFLKGFAIPGSHLAQVSAVFSLLGSRVGVRGREEGECSTLKQN